MLNRLICSLLLVAGALAFSPAAPALAAADDGIVRVKAPMTCPRP
jgi:hypothetical protein